MALAFPISSLLLPLLSPCPIQAEAGWYRTLQAQPPRGSEQARKDEDWVREPSGLGPTARDQLY